MSLYVVPALRLPARQALRINFSRRLKAGTSGGKGKGGVALLP
jgi:hypothetical protein